MGINKTNPLTCACGAVAVLTMQTHEHYKPSWFVVCRHCGRKGQECARYESALLAWRGVDVPPCKMELKSGQLKLNLEASYG